ncbi:MAG: hypothetical protein KDA92_07250, partial [Planctomycetales bacterium]|nr:hypothetical protein [Planctomycetales bacterium]
MLLFACSASSPAQAPPADSTTPRDIVSLRAELAADIQQIEASAAATENDAASYQALLLGHLRFLDSVYAQQQIVAERAKEIGQEREQISEQSARFELLGSESLQDYTFADLEDERDSLDDAEFQLSLTDSELKSTRSLLESVTEQYTANERQRRLLQEKVDRTSDPTGRAAVQRELRVIELRGRIAEELITLRKAELSVKELERQTLADKQQALASRVTLAATQVVFQKTDLDRLLNSIDEEQTRLNRLVVQLQQSLQQLETQLTTVPAPWDRATTDRVRSIRRLLHRGISDANDSLATQLLLKRHAWKMRYRVLNNLATVDEMRQMRGETAKFYERVRDAQNVTQTRSEEMRLDADVARRVQTDEQLDELQMLQSRLISEAFRESGRRHRLLRRADRLFARLQTDLTAKLGAEPDTTTWGAILPVLQSWWFYELVAVDDKPITVGKLCLGFCMVIGGVFISKQVSRAVGHRMLPKLGVHQGASLAAQTIAFYILVMLFGFFTLEFLNIPITVLTFFGGAAAIAVGFGSQ